MKRQLTIFILATLMFASAHAQQKIMLEYAMTLSNTIHKYYDTSEKLMNENYPVQKKDNKCSFLWPYSSFLSGSLALAECEGRKAVISIMDSTLIPALNRYLDTSRVPKAYASYINTSSSDRYYDDNIWLGLDFADAYLFTHKKEYLKLAEDIWTFTESGMDEKLGGGVYWCEQKRNSKNTCSNAPASVFALKLYQATKDKRYLQHGESIYRWTKTNLQDPADLIYWDNINMEGKIQTWKFAYNTGQMLQAASLLYQITGQKKYLDEADSLAEAAYKFFFDGGTATDAEGEFPLLRKGNIWFTAIMMRGYIQLYKSTHDSRYLQTFARNLNYAWFHMQDTACGLFNSDWSGTEAEKVHPLLTQGAMLEMYSRLSLLAFRR